MDHKPRILLVKLSSFGDVIHTLPTLEGLRRTFLQAHITWLVEAAYADLLRDHPALDEVWTAPRIRPGLVQLSGAMDLIRLARRLRARPFDLVIDVQGLLKSAIWVALARSPRKIGFDQTRELSYLALTERLPPYNPDEHAVLRYLRLAGYLGAVESPPRFRLPWDVAAPVQTEQHLVVLHPGARWATKLWPAVSWAALGDWLSRERGFPVALTGSAVDRELTGAIVAGMQEPALNLAGQTSLPELAAVLSRAALAVTTDTGAMHLAAALGTPVAALFGPTAPWRTGPFGEGNEIVRRGLDCSPCFRRRCPEPRCLTDLPVAMVREACEKILSRRGQTG